VRALKHLDLVEMLRNLVVVKLLERRRCPKQMPSVVLIPAKRVLYRYPQSRMVMLKQMETLKSRNRLMKMLKVA
jgi:hypothetical protein